MIGCYPLDAAERARRGDMTANEMLHRSRASNDAERVTEATFTFVALSEDGRPRPVAG